MGILKVHLSEKRRGGEADEDSLGAEWLVYHD